MVKGIPDTVNAVAPDESEARTNGLPLFDESATESVNRTMAELGVSPRTAWFTAGTYFGTGGLIVLLLALVSPTILTTGVAILGIVAIVAGAFCLFGGVMHWGNSVWATHLRLSTGIALFVIGAVVARDARIAFLMLPVFTLFMPSFFYGIRFAMPYVIAVSALVCTEALISDSPAPVAFAITSVGAMWLIAFSFMVAHRRARLIAASNRRLAFSDALTGIANTRRMRERIAFEFAVPERRRTPFALYALDLNNFSLVNDNFGRETGDRLLKAIADELCDIARPGDLVARRGGDEFSMIIGGADRRDLEQMKHEISAAVVRARISETPAISVSASVAYVRAERDDDYPSLLCRADDALHEAKIAFHTHGIDDELAAAAALRSLPRPIKPVMTEPASESPTDSIIKRVIKFGAKIGAVDAVWGFTAILFGTSGVVLAFMALAGLMRPLDPLAGGAIGLGVAATAAASYAHGRTTTSLRGLHTPFIAGTALIALAALLAGRSGQAIIDILPVIALFAFYFLPPRVASAYLVGCIGLYAGFALGGDYTYATLRVSVTTTVILVTASSIMKIRQMTIAFIRANRELSQIDPLTGLANPSALHSRVSQAISGARGGGGKPALIAIDLDGFKQVNDRYSHSAGDQTIIAVGRAIADAVETSSLVARSGGDQFIVLCDRLAEDDVEPTLARLHNAVAHARRRVCPDLPAGATIAAVPWLWGESASSFIANVELALYDEREFAKGRFERGASQA